VIKKWSFLRQMVEEAKTSKSTRVFVMSKDFNIKQNNATAWLTPEDIKNEEQFDIEEFRNSFAIGAVDLSKSGDLASARVIMMKPGSQKKYTIRKYFIPESKLGDLSKEDRDMFKQWIREDRIEVSPGNENDFSLVTAWFVKLLKDYGIRPFKVGYDKWSAIYWVKEMESYGFDCVRVAQEFGSMSEPMKLVEADLKSNLLVTNDDPIDKWCLENTALSINSKEEILPKKVQGKEDKKIDGAVTIIISYRVYIDNRTEFLSLIGR
jgi:phage terminase large subunit-like protein